MSRKGNHVLEPRKGGSSFMSDVQVSVAAGMIDPDAVDRAAVQPILGSPFREAVQLARCNLWTSWFQVADEKDLPPATTTIVVRSVGRRERGPGLLRGRSQFLPATNATTIGLTIENYEWVQDDTLRASAMRRLQRFPRRVATAKIVRATETVMGDPRRIPKIWSEESNA